MIKLTYLGQSSFHLSLKGKDILFDPMISSNKLASKIDISQIKADYILLSHGHGDHTEDAYEIAYKNKAKIISNYEIVSWFENQGIDGHPMNLGGKWKFDFGCVKYVSAAHSSMLPDGSYGGTSGGFVIWNDAISFYFSGDTALTMDMKLIPMTCPSLDFAILPIGDNFTMGYEDALIAAEFIQCNTVIACHFDTFDYIKIDHKRAIKAFQDAGKELIIPTIGMSIDIIK